MKSIVTFIVATILVLFVSIPYADTAYTHSGSSIIGILFFDLNEDGIQTPNEKVLAHTVVKIQKVDSDLIKDIITDAQGYFSITDLDSGKYPIWTEIEGRASARTLFELGEVQGAVVLNVAIPQPTSFRVLLPYVNSQSRANP